MYRQRMTDGGNRTGNGTLEIVGGAVLIALGLWLAIATLAIGSVLLIGVGVWALIVGLNKRRRATQTPTPPTPTT